MTEIIPVLAPAWLWVGACLLLLLTTITILTLACCVFRVAAALEGAAKKVDTTDLEQRIRRLEAPEPLPVRCEPPATIRESASVELPLDGDTSPGFPWHTSARP